MISATIEIAEGRAGAGILSPARGRHSRRIAAGFLLAAALFASRLLSGDHLNPAGISLHLVCYLYFTYIVFHLTRLHLEKDPLCPYGPRESAVGTLIPFSYIFWIFFWASDILARLGTSRPVALGAGILTGLAGVIAFPDNLDKLDSLASAGAFFILFATAGYIRSRI
ncbi:MAG: hypothetical protein IPM23_13470 [Candidatus Melainabacteria bacterium]|nr:hypothetical protein [Candidatus Melainabacteria bacterium]